MQIGMTGPKALTSPRFQAKRLIPLKLSPRAMKDAIMAYNSEEVAKQKALMIVNVKTPFEQWDSDLIEALAIETPRRINMPGGYGGIPYEVTLPKGQLIPLSQQKDVIYIDKPAIYTV